MSSEAKTTPWDGYPPDPERPGYHWLRRTDASIPMPAVIWTWRPEVQAWRWKGEAQMSPEEQAATKAYVAPVTSHAEVLRLRRGWLRVIQGENSCVTSGKPCAAKRCGCVAEMEMLANE